MTIYILCSDCTGIVLASHIVYALNSLFFFFLNQNLLLICGSEENIDPLTMNPSFNLSCFDRFLYILLGNVPATTSGCRPKHKGMPSTHAPVRYREP